MLAEQDLSSGSPKLGRISLSGRSLRRVSCIPGRVRWRVEGLYQNHTAAQYLKELLTKSTGVRGVEANPQTESILVFFDDSSTSADRLEGLLLQEVGLHQRSKVTPPPAPGEHLLAYHRRELYTGIVLSAVAALASLARIIFLGRALDDLLRVRRSIKAATLSIILLLGATAAYIRFKRLSRLTWIRLGRRRHFELRIEIGRRVALADLTALEQLSITDLSNAVRSNLADIERGFDGAGELVFIVANTVVKSTAFLILAPGLIWIPLLALAAMAFEARRGHSPIQQRYLRASKTMNQADRHLTELLDGLITIRSFGLERWKLANLTTAAQSYEHSSLDAAKLAAANPLRLELITLLGVAAVTLWAGPALAAGTMTMGSHLALMMIAGHMFYPFSTLGPPLDSANRGLAAHKTLQSIQQIPIEADTPGSTICPEALRVAITFENINFRYPTGSEPSLKDVSLHIPAGSFVGVVGPSGSGKSTIMKLLLRFYDPTSGSIRIDGIDIRHLDRRKLRLLFASVDQQSFLFEETIAHNIAVGQEHFDHTAIRNASAAASLHNFVNSLPEGYATEIGTRGNRLSDGQRQRLLIARALLKQASVLILDEPTSNIDATTEQVVLSNIRNLSAGRTVIVIAHRLATVKAADKIFVLESGRVVETGTHDNLVRKKDGLYRSLWFSQHKKKSTLI